MSDDSAARPRPPRDATDLQDAEREALLTVAHGAVVTSGGISVQRALLTATEFVLARAFGPVVYGVYALAWRIAQLCFRFVNFGTVSTLQRYVPADAADSVDRGAVVGLAYATTGAVGFVIGTALFVAADAIDAATLVHPAFPPTMRIFGALVGIAGLVRIHASVLRAVGSARGEVAFNRILRPLARFLGGVAALALGYSVVGVAGAMVAAVAAVAAAGFPVVARGTGIRPRLRGSRPELRRFFNHATPVALSSLGKVFQSRIDVVLVGLLLTATAAGTYNVVLVLVSIAWIPLLSFNQLMPPIASDLHGRDRTATLNGVYTAVTRLILTAVVPLVAIQLAYGRAILATFGPTYVGGYLPLVVYLGGVLVGSAVGATGWLLMMTDHQYARMALDWLLAATNVALTYLFVLSFGLVGAALGTAVAITVQNSIQVVLLRRFEGLWPFDATFLKPLVAGAAMTGVLVVVRDTLTGPGSVVVGLVLGIGTYAGGLYVLGINPRDRLVVGELTGRYRRDLAGLVAR